MNDYVRLRMGNVCNNNCMFCDAFGEKAKNKTTVQLKKELRVIKDFSQTVIFTGGEPTLRKDLLELLSHAKGLGFRSIAIRSNGRMFSYPDFCRKVIGAGANVFMIKVFHHPEMKHDDITRLKGSLRQSVAGMNNLF